MQERKFALDYLKLVFAFCVVGLHTQFLGEFSSLAEQLSVHGIFRIAVPLFITISGYYFYESLSLGNAAKWIKRLCILYAVWMLLYAPLWVFQNNTLASIPRIIGTAVFGYHHLWYVVAMAFAAVLMVACKNWRTSVLVGLSVLLFALGWSIQLIGVHDLLEVGILQNISDSSKSYRNFVLFVFPFLAIGFLIRKHSLIEKTSMATATSMAVAGVGLVLAESGLHYAYAGEKLVPLDLLVGLPVACAGLFIAAMKPVGTRSTKGIALFASAIYFVHPWVIHGGIATGLSFTALTAFSIALSIPIAAVVVVLSRRFKFIL